MGIKSYEDEMDEEVDDENYYDDNEFEETEEEITDEEVDEGYSEEDEDGEEESEFMGELESSVKEVSKTKNKTKKSKEETKIENTSSWAVPLKNDIEITEFGKSIFRYENLLNPDGEPTQYYSCHTKMSDEKEWVTCDRLLSSRYIIGKLEPFVSDFVNAAKNVENGTVVHEKFLISWTGEVNKKMNLFSDDLDKEIFSMFTGIDSEKFGKFNTKLNIMFLNSYNGKKSFNFDFVLQIMDSKKSFNFKDYFILNIHSEKVTHKGNFSEISNKIINIFDDIEDTIEILKNDKEHCSALLSALNSKLGLKISNRLNATWENSIHADNKNMLSLLLLISYILRDEMNLEMYTRIRPIVTKHMKRVFKQENN